MSNKVIHNGIKLALLPFISSSFSADKIEHATKTEQSIQLSDAKLETGWDRVKKMFQLDEFGNISTEANSVLQATCLSLLVGGIYGGTMQSKIAYEQFMRNNDATTFKTHLEAKKKLQDTVTLAFGKGAFKWGWRLTLFSTTYVAVSTVIQLYRGKYGIMEYVGAGAVTGFMYKFNAGPRGWVVGSGLGMVLGLICGGATLGILKVSGLSMEEARYWQYKWKEGPTEYMRKGREKYKETEDFPVVKLHNDEVGEAGKSIFNLDKDSNTKDDKNVK